MIKIGCITVYHRLIDQPPPRKPAVVRRRDGCYDGWTGFEWFGVITEYRYYGWCVTCWADVMAVRYGRANINPFFSSFEAAVKELEWLMYEAGWLGRLSNKPVNYASSFTAQVSELQRLVRDCLSRMVPHPGSKAIPRNTLHSPAFYRRAFPIRDDGTPQTEQIFVLCGGHMLWNALPAQWRGCDDAQ